MKNFVIVGSGFSAINTAIKLARYFDRSSFYKIYLVSEKNYLTYKPLLPKFSFETNHTAKHKKHIALSIKEIIENTKVKYIHKRLSRIDLQKNTIRFEDKSKLEFYKLILASESEIDNEKIQGLRHYAHFIHDLSGSVETNNAYKKTLTDSLKVYRALIIGSGIAGVEAACAINSSLKKNLPNNVLLQTILIDQSDQIVRELNKKVGLKIERILKNKNIHLIKNKKVKRVYKHCVQFSTGKIQEYEFLVYAGGVVGSHLLEDLKFVTDKDGFLVTNDYFQIPKDPNLYAIADARAKDSSRTIQSNLEESNLLAQNIYALVMHKNQIKYQNKTDTCIDLANKVIKISPKNKITNNYRAYWSKNFQEFKLLVSFLPSWKAINIWSQIISIYFRK